MPELETTGIRTPAQLGSFIKIRRLELGFDQASLAHRAGISRVWLIEIEKGTPGVSLAVVLRVLAALKASLSVSIKARPSRPGTGPSTSPPVDLNNLIENIKKSFSHD